MTPALGLIVSTYNRPEALRAVLASACDQVFQDFELLVADDGSGDATKELVQEFQRTGAISIQHVWQEDRGFRLAAIRNRAVAASGAPYLVFIDGDCLMLPDFLKRHWRLAERGFFVRGSNVDMSPALTAAALQRGAAAHRWGLGRWLGSRLNGHVNRCMPFFRLPLGPLRKFAPRSPKGACGRNLALWREDFLAVNGFNEAYEGYGKEDWDLVDRLIKYGVYRKNGRFAVPVIHLWHGPNAPGPNNERMWEAQERSARTWVDRGVDQYL